MMKQELIEEMENYNLDTLADEIRKKDYFELYKKNVQLFPNSTTDIQLAAFTLLESMIDKRLSLMVQRVSADILFKMLDLKFRNEILSKPEGKDASV